MKFTEVESIEDIPKYPTVNTYMYLIFISDGDVVGGDTWDIYLERNEVAIYDSYGNKTKVIFTNNKKNNKCLILEY